MRSEFGPERFLLASKKPHIKNLISSLSTMTEDEIKSLKEKPDVIKGLLNIKKSQDQSAALSRAEKIADAMIAAQLKQTSN
jgi:REP element-mobilizing transposase RayT